MLIAVVGEEQRRSDVVVGVRHAVHAWAHRSGRRAVWQRALGRVDFLSSTTTTILTGSVGPLIILCGCIHNSVHTARLAGT
jgi:hypothetical protein